MSNLIESVRHLPFGQRIVIFHAGMIVLGAAFLMSSASWFSLIFGSLMIGSAAAATFHHFRPYTLRWSAKKAFFVRFAHGLVTLAEVYICLWGRFLEYGALVGETVSWSERIAGFLLAGTGFLVAGIILGKGRFEPPVEVVFGKRPA